MKTHTESSKSELSSRGKQPFKVFVQNFNKKVSMSPLFKKVATRTGEGNMELALSTIPKSVPKPVPKWAFAAADFNTQI